METDPCASPLSLSTWRGISPAPATCRCVSGPPPLSQSSSRSRSLREALSQFSATRDSTQRAEDRVGRGRSAGRGGGGGGSGALRRSHLGRLPAFASWPRSLDPMDALCGSKFWVRRCPGTEGAHPRAPERALGRGCRREGVWPCHPHPQPDPCPGRMGPAQLSRDARKSPGKRGTNQKVPPRELGLSCPALRLPLPLPAAAGASRTPVQPGALGKLALLLERAPATFFSLVLRATRK